MKKLALLISIVILSAPVLAFGSTSVPWTLANMSNNFISPALVNGSTEGLILNASSTLVSGLFSANGGASTTVFSANTICLTGDICRTTWPTGGGGGGVGTSTVPFMANYYVATSTLFASVFPYASTTAVTTTNLCFTGTSGCITSATSTNYWYANGTNIYNANAGNVGIGTTTPNYKLAVAGNGNSSISIGDVSGIANYAGISLNGNGTAGSGTFNFLSSTADSNLYINRPTGAAIQFREQNGTAQMTLQSGGNVGIGTTSPIEKLSILSADNVQTTNIFAVRANNLTQGVALGWNSIREIGTNSNNNFLVDAQGTGGLLLQTVSGGNVGIGTSTPPSKLWVLGTQAAPSLTNDGAVTQFGGVAATQAIAFGLDPNSPFDGWIQVKRSNNDGTSFPLALNPLGGNVAVGTTTPSANLVINGTTGQNLFQIATSTNQGIFTVNKNGNVGIGTGSPIGNIDIFGGSGNSQLEFSNSTTGNGSGGFIGQLGGNDLFYTNQTATGNLFFGTNNMTRMAILPGGNVGVGSTTPWGQLSASSTSAYPTLVVSQNSTGPAAIFTGGNVGIGTTTPGSLLSLGVSGNASGINFGLATSTFENAGGINLTFGCFAINGTCVGGSGGGGTVTSVTGTYPVQSTGGATPAISLAFGTTTANMWSALQLFNGAASSSLFSVQGGPLWIGGTSTSTIQGNGATSTLQSTLVVASTSPNAFVVQDQYGTQDLRVSTASSTNNNPILQVIGTSTPGALFQIDQYGHLLASSTSPTPAISSCGTGSPAMGTNANDVVGTFTTGTSASSCTITFGSAYSATPVVVISDSNTTAVADISSVSTTGFTISLASALSAVNVYYMVVMP